MNMTNSHFTRLIEFGLKEMPFENQLQGYFPNMFYELCQASTHFSFIQFFNILDKSNSEML